MSRVDAQRTRTTAPDDGHASDTGNPNSLSDGLVARRTWSRARERNNLYFVFWYSSGRPLSRRRTDGRVVRRMLVSKCALTGCQSENILFLVCSVRQYR